LKYIGVLCCDCLRMFSSNKFHTLLPSSACCACRNDIAHHCLDEHPFEDTDAYFYRFVTHEPPEYLLQRCTPASLSSTLRPIDGSAIHEVPVFLHCRARIARDSSDPLAVFLPPQGCGRRHSQLCRISSANIRRFGCLECACKQRRRRRVFGCKQGTGSLCSVG
jgi:hypothetical protein